jgi:hypothetical protein
MDNFYIFERNLVSVSRPSRRGRERPNPPSHAGVQVERMFACCIPVEEPSEVVTPLRLQERQVDPRHARQVHDALRGKKRVVF